MNDYLEEKAPSFFLGCAIGALALGLGGFVWPGHWVSGTTAHQMVRDAQDKATIAALAPACVAAFMATPNAQAELAVLKKKDEWDRGGEIAKLVKIPGVKTMDDDVASECASDLLHPKKT